MRELARREPTFALHVHVGVADADAAIRLMNRMRGHIPLLLALSGNSPLWQGRDTGLASARTPLFQAFPRVGIPRAFEDYADWTEAVDLLLRCDAFDEPTYLWWDVRPQPRFGTVEVRIMDVQSTVAETVALTALVQSIAKLELEQGYCRWRCSSIPSCWRRTASSPPATAWTPPARPNPRAPRYPPGSNWTPCSRPAPRTRRTSGARKSSSVRDLAENTGAARQLELSTGEDRLLGVVAALAELFTSDAPAGPEGEPARRGAGAGGPAA